MRRRAVEALLLLLVVLLTRAAIRIQVGDCVCRLVPNAPVGEEADPLALVIVTSYVLLYVDTGMAIVDTGRLREIFYFENSRLVEQVLGGGVTGAIVL